MHSGHSCLRYRKHLLRSPQLLAASTESSKENSMSINLMAVSALPQETKSFSAKIARMRRYNKKKIDMVLHIKVAYTRYGYNSGLQKRPVR